METQTAIVLFALVAAFGLVTVVVANIILTAQEAEASRGCFPNPHAPAGGGIAVNASKGRCVH